MIENELLAAFRRCTAERKSFLVTATEILANVTDKEAEEQRKAAQTAQVIPFKPRAELAKEA